MERFDSSPNQPRRAAVGTAGCLAALALLSAMLMLFDHAAGIAWDGLDPALARHPAACPGPATAACATRVALAASAAASATVVR